MLQITSRKLKEMQVRQGFKLAYRSATQDITECNTHINEFLFDYAVILSFYKMPRVSCVLTVLIFSAV